MPKMKAELTLPAVPVSFSAGVPLSRTIRCTCISISDKSVNPNSLEKLEMIPATQSCPRVEIMWVEYHLLIISLAVIIKIFIDHNISVMILRLLYSKYSKGKHVRVKSIWLKNCVFHQFMDPTVFEMFSFLFTSIEPQWKRTGKKDVWIQSPRSSRTYWKYLARKGRFAIACRKTVL